MFKIFKNHTNDFIVYDVQNDKFFKNKLPEVSFQLSVDEHKTNSSITDYCSFKNLLSNFQIVLYEGHYYYNDLSSDSPTATDVRPPSIPEHWNQEEVVASYVDKLSRHEEMKVAKYIKLLFKTTIENLALHISDYKLGSICSNFVRHNQLRSLHEDTQPLILDFNLCHIAAERAENMLNDAEAFAHPDLNEFGENLYFSQQDSEFDLINPPPSGGTVAQSWYDEINDYDGTYSDKTGHYTQLVWTSTFFVGFGTAVRGDRFYCVALYYPPGFVNDDEDGYLTNVNNLKSPEVLEREARLLRGDTVHDLEEEDDDAIGNSTLRTTKTRDNATSLKFKRLQSEGLIKQDVTHNSSELIKSVIAKGLYDFFGIKHNKPYFEILLQ